MLSGFLRIPFALLALTLTTSWAQSYTGPEDPRVKVEIVLQHPVNGVSTTPDGRIFLLYARVDGSSGPQVVEYFPESGTQKAFPNVAWNTLEAGDDFTQHFLGVNSQRVGPDGNLYIVDKGATGFGVPVKLPYGPKVVVVDLKTNKVSRVYLLGGVQRHDSLLGESSALVLEHKVPRVLTVPFKTTFASIQQLASPILRMLAILDSLF